MHKFEKLITLTQMFSIFHFFYQVFKISRSEGSGEKSGGSLKFEFQKAGEAYGCLRQRRDSLPAANHDILFYFLFFSFYFFSFIFFLFSFS